MNNDGGVADPALSRREFLRWLGGGIGLAVAGYLAACAPPVPSRPSCAVSINSQVRQLTTFPKDLVFRGANESNMLDANMDPIILRTEGLVFTIVSQPAIRKQLSPNGDYSWFTPDAYAYLHDKYKTRLLNGEIDDYIATVLKKFYSCDVDPQFLVTQPTTGEADQLSNLILDKGLGITGSSVIGATAGVSPNPIPGGNKNNYQPLPADQSEKKLLERTNTAAAFFMNSQHPLVQQAGRVLDLLLKGKVPNELIIGSCNSSLQSPLLNVSTDSSYLSVSQYSLGTGKTGDGLDFKNINFEINEHVVAGATAYGFNRMIFQELLNMIILSQIVRNSLSQNQC